MCLNIYTGYAILLRTLRVFLPIKIGLTLDKNRNYSFSKYAKFSEKLTFLTPFYAHVRMRIRGVRNASFSGFCAKFVKVTKITLKRENLLRKCHILSIYTYSLCFDLNVGLLLMVF